MSQLSLSPTATAAKSENSARASILIWTATVFGVQLVADVFLKIVVNDTDEIIVAKSKIIDTRLMMQRQSKAVAFTVTRPLANVVPRDNTVVIMPVGRSPRVPSGTVKLASNELIPMDR